MSQRKRNILLLGSYGRGNLGDDIFLMSAVQLFEGHKLFINSANDNLLPASTRGKTSTISTTKLELFKKIKTFTKIQDIVYYGGDLWVELHGEKYPRQSLYKMLFVNCIARLFLKRVHYIGCGIGELEGYSLSIAKLSAQLATTIIVREQRSAEILALQRVKVLPDLAFTLSPPPTSATINSGTNKKTKIGISLLYYLPNPKVTFPMALNQLSQFVLSLPEDRYEIIFLPMMRPNGNAKDDYWVYQQLKKKVPNREITLCDNTDFQDYMHSLSQLDIVIGTRLHANILSILAGVPCIGIAYRKKVERLFIQNKLDDYCVNLEEMHMLTAKVSYMLSQKEQVNYTFLDVRKRNIEEGTSYQKAISKIF